MELRSGRQFGSTFIGPILVTWALNANNADECGDEC